MIERERVARAAVVLPSSGEPPAIIGDLPYRQLADGPLLADIYRPATSGSDMLLPVVVFVHGDASADWGTPKDWGQYQGWGRLTAGVGLAAVTFNHRSSERLTRLAEAASDVDALIAWLRVSGAVYGLDVDRVCLWCCSAGVPYGVRVALRAASSYIRAVVAYYGLLDLRHLGGEVPEGVTEATLHEFSALAQLEATGTLPPTLIVKAARDNALINDSIDRFVVAARAAALPVEYHIHEQGQHAFDVRDDDERSRAIIARTLAFMQAALTSED